MAEALNVSTHSAERKVVESIRRSLPHLPGEARAAVEALVSPEAIAVVSGTLVLWAGSHFTGIGQIVDVILLAVGVVLLGNTVWDLAQEIWSFARVAVSAKNEQTSRRLGGTLREL